jgi:Double-GTPase 2
MGEGGLSLDVSAETAPLQKPPQNPRFPLSRTLTPPQMRELMAARYCRLIGILGAPDAGKTAALVSLYLLLARDKLAGIHFADSRTLMSFDEISAGAQRWNEGKLPEQLTAHTELKEDRSAGFLHLRLKPDGQDPVDILLPDLPGEWTTSLLERNRVDRLQFLKGADLVWLMIDGRQLFAPEKRQWTLHRAKLLMQRLAALVAPAPPVILVITRRDKTTIEAATLDELKAEAKQTGLTMTIAQIASFADDGEIDPGTGIRDLVLASIQPVAAESTFWPDSEPLSHEQRAVLRLRAGCAA